MSMTQEKKGAAALILPFGPHQGMSIRQVSHRWLTWLARQSGEFNYEDLDWVLEAKSELGRRGTNYDGIPPTYHAIDRFSQHHLHKWTDRKVGLAAYVSQLGDLAWIHGKVCAIDKDINPQMEVTIHKYYEGMTFIFHCDRDSKAVALKTIR